MIDMVKETDLSYIPMEELLDKIGSRYKLVILASRRATELAGGKQRLVDISPLAKASTIALEEIRKGKIDFKEVKEKK